MHAEHNIAVVSAIVQTCTFGARARSCMLACACGIVREQKRHIMTVVYDTTMLMIAGVPVHVAEACTYFVFWKKTCKIFLPSLCFYGVWNTCYRTCIEVFHSETL